ncbi:LacI family DNA-binding transcriptional regulator [Candidatus Leptofilum sp.]|uniref:LacI family DNA-binding transcriptional regulator n=1 Tax=Candidatus Leptofilum sp. TaxID=3241576 RepID=UPI003B5B3997
MTTIKDVAKRAGVSFKTVSRVLNDDTAVRDSTRAKVMEAVKELDYRPNMMARSLRSQRTHTIGFISDEIGTSPFAGNMLQGAQDRAWEQEILLLSINTGRDPDLKKTAVETLLDRQVDGIVYAAMYHRAVNPPAAIYTTPSVLLDCYVEDNSLPSVVPDEHLGGYTATQHLINRGYRKIAMINHDGQLPASTGREAGYRQALLEAGIQFNPLWIIRNQSRMDGGYRAANQLIQQVPDIEAVFCFHDRMAMGVYQALNERQIKIPNDIAIVGFDNEPDFAEYFRPPLTTLELPHYEMGRWAVNHLIELIANPNEQFAANKHKKTWECPLIVRESS